MRVVTGVEVARVTGTDLALVELDAGKIGLDQSDPGEARNGPETDSR